ncbi:MAG: radical SAM protein [Ignavibacteriaceae bacterium]
MNKVILFNPKSAKYKHRIPNSVLQIGASIHGKFKYIFIDGNLENNPLNKIKKYLDTGEFKYFGSTVMPGPQLKQAIPFTKYIKENYQDVITIWGGYFPSEHPKVILNSGCVDFIIDGPGDTAFPKLLNSLENEKNLIGVENLIFKKDGKIIKTQKAPLIEQDDLPELPYDYLNEFYPLKNYLGKTFLGNKTHAYHSSLGCPFTCSFCSVVPIYNARWKGKSAERMYREIKYVKEKYGADAIEFHDNNFFVSEKRTVEFSKLIMKENMNWWGEGRIDTIDKFKDESIDLMRKAGCRMIFFGAETGNDKALLKMDKGGTQNAKQIKSFAKRIKNFDIIPEYSFILGLPGENEKDVMQQIDSDINFIREIKEINPDTEIIIYVYSPVPVEGSELYNSVTNMGFKFPEKLEDWFEPEWESFDLRINPLTPWLNPEMINKIRNFETVLNGYSPTISDYKLTKLQRKAIKLISTLRYKKKIYNLPLEIKALQRFWLKYRQPQIEGFFME